jgi:tellurite resistance protein
MGLDHHAIEHDACARADQESEGSAGEAERAQKKHPRHCDHGVTPFAFEGGNTPTRTGSLTPIPGRRKVGYARRMNRDVFIALAAVAWADGQLDPDEADAIVRAAAEEGLDIDEIAAIESATESFVDLGVIDRSGLSKEERLFVYAVACWIARMDGVVTDAESSALARLGERLGVPERPRGHAESIAREVAELPEGDRPARYDLPRLRRLLGERLRASAAANDAAAARARQD